MTLTENSRDQRNSSPAPQVVLIEQFIHSLLSDFTEISRLKIGPVIGDSIETKEIVSLLFWIIFFLFYCIVVPNL
jgi:hypothetical protein